MKFFKQLKNCDLFEGFSDADINKLFDVIDAKIVKYSRGQLIVKAGEPVTDLFIILDGNLVAYNNKNNKPELVRSMSDGESYGAEVVFGPTPVYPFNVAAALDSTVLYIKPRSLLDATKVDLAIYEKVVNNLLRSLNEKIYDLENNRGYITIKGMRKKIAKLVYDKYTEQGVLTVDLGMNRNEMAKFLNVSRPSMSREMMRMRDNDGIFEFRKNIVEIKDLAALKRIATEGE